MRLLAIDFGTSNTVAALLIDGQAPRTVTFDTSPLLPSAVFIAADGQVTVGRDAQRLARLDPARYEPNPKRRIDDGEVLLGDRVVPVVDVIAAVLRAVATEVRRQLGGAAPDQVRLTHPAQWGAIRQNVLVSAARAAGLGTNLLLIPEPVAAAAQFTRLPGRTLPPGGSVAVYDLGGGTFDIAIVGRADQDRQAGPGAEPEFHVLAEAGLPDLGGLDFDQAILDQVGRTTSSTDPARWQQILRPVDASGRRAARALAEDVRASKEALSRYPQTDVSLPEPFVDAHLTRTEFEGLIRPNLLRSIEVLSTVLKNAGIAPDRLGGIFLVGGSSRIPLVAGLIQDRLHVTPVALDQPETAVALGALLVPARDASNRTVALGDRSPYPFASAAASYAGGPPSVGVPSVGRLPGGVAAHGPVPRAEHAGPQPQGHRSSALPAPVPPRRRRLVAAAGGLVVLVVIGLVLALTGVFSSRAPAADPTAGPAVSSSPPVTTPALESSAGPASRSTGARTGLGPAKIFTVGEMMFMSNNVSGLLNCSDITSAFNSAVPAKFNVVRAVRCGVPTGAPGNLSDNGLVYVMTVKGSVAAATYVGQMYLDRQQNADGSSKNDTDNPITAGAVTGQVITAYDLPTFGKSTYDATQGASVLGWHLDQQRYVGMVVSLTPTAQSDLRDYWAQNYKPRG